ncbi:hypothetical protein AsAng_0053900 [Aureispira anguillae]|uniref:Uncharacterized protein n=1 Tax=Aureispira anguillae TaxID=2864201 RepID=A0A915YJZ5_9BACT|nr:hypothetical protein AsAng_0053900 [Aureispira anguillae]
MVKGEFFLPYNKLILRYFFAFLQKKQKKHCFFLYSFSYKLAQLVR